VLEKELKEVTKSPLPPFTKGGSPLLVFKGGQNGIFLEESVKHFLKRKDDENLLTRQGARWQEKKREFL